MIVCAQGRWYEKVVDDNDVQAVELFKSMRVTDGKKKKVAEFASETERIERAWGKLFKRSRGTRVDRGEVCSVSSEAFEEDGESNLVPCSFAKASEVLQSVRHDCG